MDKVIKQFHEQRIKQLEELIKEKQETIVNMAKSISYHEKELTSSI